MKKLTSISFWLLFTLSMAAIVFTSCSKKDSKGDPSIAATGISLDKTTLSLAIGEEYTFTATVTPDNATDKTVTWTSSDASKATINNGKVTAVATGTVTITATVGDKTVTCTVTVSPTRIAVTGIALDKTTLFLTVGGTYTLSATVSPVNATDKTVTWTSSDATKATVANGKVIGVAAGTVTITAKAGDKTATCIVTLQPAAVIALPTIVTATATQITSNSAVLGGEITSNGGGSITSRGVCYSETDPNPTIAGSITTITTSNSIFSFTLNGLSATKTYFVRAYATNSKGTGYGEVISFTTPALAPVTGVVIGGVTWATSNVASPGTFASTESSAGLLYQWNRITGWNTTELLIAPTVQEPYRQWDTSSSASSSWSSSYDPCPLGWRMPTTQELQSLVSKYKEYVYRNGVMGHTFGEGNAEIFLPVPGYRSDINQGILLGGAIQTGTQSIYWTSEQSTVDKANIMTLYKEGPMMSTIQKASGGSCRCVAK